MTRLLSRSRRSLAVLAAVLGSACVDGTGPNLEGAAVRIYLGTVIYDEQTIALGQMISLTGSVYNASGSKVDGQVVEWRSDKPEVATVTPAGVVTGVAVGTTLIIAKHRVGEDSARINVAVPITGAVGCVAGEEQTLTVGESRVFTEDAATRLCLPGGPAAPAEYALVVSNVGGSSAANLSVRMQAVGTRGTFFAPVPLRSPIEVEAPPMPDEAFHQHLRHDVSARLESRLRAGVDPAHLVSSAPRFQATVGQVLTFNVESSSSNGCSSPVMRGFRVRAVSEKAIVVADTLNPANGFSDADYQEFASFFDSDVWPMSTHNFGESSDIDKNGKVFILFTRAVNDRPENTVTGSTFVGGFFFNRDLFPKSGQSACEGSNVAEMFYMLVPNPSPKGTERFFATAFVNKNTKTVLTHEFQHLINDSRRLHINRALIWEETWMNEGLSHIAEELMFYRRSGLSPRSNLNETTFPRGSLANEQFGLFQLDNLSRLSYYLKDPEAASLMGSDVLATRGESWLFLRYAADRRGGDEAAFWRALVRDPKVSGLLNLELAIGQDPRVWIGDQLAAIYLDDAGFSTDAKYTMPSWNLRRIYPALPSLWSVLDNATYPLRIYQTSSPADRTVSLQGSGAVYFRSGVNTGLRGAIRFTVGGLPPPARMKVVVTRTR